MTNQNKKISDAIQGLPALANIKYKKPENKNDEYIKSLFANQGALIYLIRDRGLDLETIKHFQLGLSPSGNLTIPNYKDGELIDYKARTIPPKEKGFVRTPGSLTWLFNADDGLKEGRKKGGVIITEGECFTGDAEILTPNGWINLDSYDGELVAQYNKGVIEFVEPRAYIVKNYSGYLIEFSNAQKFYSLTTPNHNLVLLNGNKLFKRKAKDINSTPYHVPRTALHDGNGIELNKDEIRLCIAVSADFSIRKEGDIYGAFKKQRKIKRIKSILDKLKIKYSSNRESRGRTNIFIRRGDAPKYLFKEFPHNWIYQTSLIQKKIILDEILYWDGNSVPNRNQIEYSSKFLSNSKFIQTIAHLTGYVSTIIKRSNKFGKWYKVSILWNKSTTNTQSLYHHKKNIKYNGNVYCVQINSGMLLVRQDGCISVSGNCDAMSVWQAGFKNVVSVTGGSLSVGPWVMEFDDIPLIYLNYDSDPVGQKGAKALAERIGLEKCFNVVLPVKDANDFFQKYDSKQFMNVLASSKKFPIKDVSSLSDMIDELKEAEKDGGEKDFKFGYPKLDELTGGFSKQNLIMVSGFSGQGKTTWLYNVCINLSNKNTPILYCPLEDNPRYSAKRMINILTKTNVSGMAEDMWDGLKESIIHMPLYMYTGNPEEFDIDTFKKIVEIGKKVYGIEVFILDHIHFLAKRSKSMTEEVGFIVRELIGICRKYDVALITVAHIRKNQDNYGSKSSNSMPQMESLKDSATLYQDSHMVLMLLQKEEEEIDPNYANHIKVNTYLELAVQKNREGMTTFADKPLLFDFNKYIGTIEEHKDEQKEESIKKEPDQTSLV